MDIVVDWLISPVYIADFLAVGMGALLGHQLSARRERHLQAERERDDRQRLRDSIAGELGGISENIGNWEGEVPPTIAFPTGSYESGVSSGTFSLLSEDLQRELNAVYDDIERISTQQRFLREQLIATDRADIDRSRVGNFRNEIQSLEARIDEVVERL
ncbi:hypothetical protein KY092_13905 [Natronomonas gomsonensis]|jgi:hypothetical protein|uniref:hypothetical protein n=1 Tax=Natronomonas TaxID=63743 RepID=UPI0018D238B4|nr:MULTISPECIES: hypothetical protein [Natronomonas]MCY4731648.1 hypothetical protein [Natronomonas gomsonensis]